MFTNGDTYTHDQSIMINVQVQIPNNYCSKYYFSHDSLEGTVI